MIWNIWGQGPDQSENVIIVVCPKAHLSQKFHEHSEKSICISAYGCDIAGSVNYARNMWRDWHHMEKLDSLKWHVGMTHG